MNRQERRMAEAKYKKEVKKATKLAFTPAPFPEMIVSSGTEEKKCYAKCLGNCGGGITKEHYISENLLEQFDFIYADGIPWIGTTIKKAPAAVLVSKVLCKYHNEYLSPLDDFAGKVFSEIHTNWVRKNKRVSIIDGYGIEKWFLKVLLGLIATGRFADDSRQFNRSDIPNELVETLFGLREFYEGHGIYINYVVGDKIGMGKRFSASPLFLNGTIGGLRVSFAGIELYLSLFTKEEAFSKIHPNYSTILYRPSAINKKPFPQELRFKWKLR